MPTGNSQDVPPSGHGSKSLEPGCDVDEDENDDDISLTSTVSSKHDSDEEFEVEGIRAEQTLENGETQYLIEWVNYPFYKCTWEPWENLDPNTRIEWAQILKDIEGGLRPHFQVEIDRLKREVDAFEAASKSRKGRRAAKRKRLNLQMPSTPEVASDQEGTGRQSLQSPAPFQQDEPDEPNGTDEVDEPETVEKTVRPQKPAVATELGESSNEAQGNKEGENQTREDTMTLSAPGRRQSMSKGPPERIPDRNPTAASSRRPSNAATANTANKAGAATVTNQKTAGGPGSGVLHKSTRTRTDAPSATGYQGTARKSSTHKKLSTPTTAAQVKPGPSQGNGNDPRSTTTQSPSGSIPIRQPTAAQSDSSGGGRKTTMKKTRKQRQDAFVNVFAGGTKVKSKRRRLEDAVQNPSLEPKLFSSFRIRRQVELRGRDRENEAPPLADVEKFYDLRDGPNVGPRGSRQGSKSDGKEGMDGEENGQAVNLPERRVSEPNDHATTADHSTAAAAGDDEDTKAESSKRTRKSVRFAQGNSPSPEVNNTGPWHGTDADAPVNFGIGALTDEPMAMDLDQADGESNNEPMDIDDDILSPACRRLLGTPATQSSALASSSVSALTSASTSGSVVPTQTAPIKKLSLTTYKALKSSSRDVVKKVTMGVGTAAACLAEACFSTVPRDSDQPWLAAFLAEEAIHFGHICLADVFVDRIDQIRSEGGNLCSGTVTCTAGSADERSLAAVSDYLQSTASGLFCVHPNQITVLYSARSEEWKAANLATSEADTADTAAGGSATPGLRYAMFATIADCGPFLNWNPPSSAPLEDVEEPPDRARIMKAVFNLSISTYHKLVPPPVKAPSGETRGRRPRDTFFLLFPLSLGDSICQTAHWLRACNPDCEIHINQLPGSWMSFLSKMKESAESPGILIVHESAVPMLRRIPHLLDFLDNSRKHFVWCWPDKSHGPPSLLPSSGPSSETGDGLFDVEPIRLFPHSHIVLVTPSFLVSEPHRACHFFQHIFRHSSNHGAGKDPRKEQHFFLWKLMVASNILEFLEDLAIEKATERTQLMDDPKGGSISSREIDANLRGLTMEDCRRRFLLIDVVHQEINSRTDPLTGEQSSLGPLLFADDGIDASDEQSLVNWFGWWSIAHADQCRKFHVLGSGPSRTPPNDAGQQLGHNPRDNNPSSSRRARCVVRIPNFRRGTINDPDAAQARQEAQQKAQEQAQQQAQQAEAEAQQHAQQAEAEAQAQEEAQAEAQAQTQAQHAAVTERRPSLYDQQVFHSEIVQSDSAGTLEKHLWSLQKTGLRKPGTYRLYAYPVLWQDASEAYKYGYLEGGRHDIKSWFNYTFAFDMRYRVYVALFYTVEDGYDPAKAPHGHKTPRHPWVAIYRSTSPLHADLVIIDATIKDAVRRTKTPAEADLAPAQQHAIRFIREHEHEKRHDPKIQGKHNPMPQRLSRVWIGDIPSAAPVRPGPPGPPRLATALDRCLAFLDRFLDDLDILPSRYPELVRQGYKLVSDFSPGRPQPPAEAKAADEGADEARHGAQKEEEAEEDDDGPDAKVVFHPPRAPRQQQQQQQQQPAAADHAKSRCVNHLYEKARLTRLKRPSARTMRYEYRPTLEWYAEQEAEGRGFEHVHVNGWEVICAKAGAKGGARSAGVGAGGKAAEDAAVDDDEGYTPTSASR